MQGSFVDVVEYQDPHFENGEILSNVVYLHTEHTPATDFFKPQFYALALQPHP